MPLSKTGSTQENSSQHDGKVVDWDVKNQNKTKLVRVQRSGIDTIKYRTLIFKTFKRWNETILLNITCSHQILYSYQIHVIRLVR